MKRVKIEIESLIEELDEAGLVESADKTRTVSEGKMESDGSKILLTYTEESENEKINSKVSVKEGEVTVSRRGGAEYDFIFREGERTSALYSIPPYSFDAEIYTKRIRSTLGESGGEVSLIYEMTLGGAKKRTKMKILVSEK